MKTSHDPYGFIMRGEVAQTAIDQEVRSHRDLDSDLSDKIPTALPLDLLDNDMLASSQKMAVIYAAIAAFENSARKFIEDRLLEDFGADWWEKKVPSKIRTEATRRKDDEQHNRYHGTRGASMIFYTQLGDLTSIMNATPDAFVDYIPSIEWARQIFSAIERSRNVIMHSGELSMNDIQRVGMNIRDWLQQVGG
jgi:hypothetical protein